MFTQQKLAGFVHALTVAAMPFSTVIGLVLLATNLRRDKRNEGGES